MAALGWLFVGWLFRPWLPAAQIDSYIAGLIILAAAPCTAMVFVWSNLTDGDPNFTLSQVALNDTIMVVAFAPIVGLLLGLSSITVPWQTLFLSVALYIVVPVIAAQVWRRSLVTAGGAGGQRHRRFAKGHRPPTRVHRGSSWSQGTSRLAMSEGTQAPAHPKPALRNPSRRWSTSPGSGQFRRNTLAETSRFASISLSSASAARASSILPSWPSPATT
jgi:hypothetical protein